MPAVMTQRNPSETRLHVLAMLFFGGLAFIILHAMLFHNGTHTAGYDVFNYHWNYWWIRHVSQTPGLNVYLNDFVFYPAMSTYGYHALAAFWYPVWAVIEPIAGRFTAFNAIIFIGCFLNGYVTFAFLRREGIAPALALIGGAALQALPIARYSYFNSHLNLMNWFWLPANLMLWAEAVKAARARSVRRALYWAVIHGIALYGLSLCDHQFPIFTAFVLGPYALATLIRTPQRLRLIGAGLATVGIGAALLWFAGPIRYMLMFSGTLAPANVEVRPGIPFLGGLFSMSETWWMWNTPSLGAFVPLALIVTLILFVRRRRMATPDRWFWFVVALPPLILALGPTLRIGEVAIPLPYRLLFAVTGGLFGMPWRLAPIFVLAILVFIGKSWTPALAGRPKRALATAVIAMLGMAASYRLFESGPITPVWPEYETLNAIGAERGPELDRLVVVDVPTGVGTGEVLLGKPEAVALQWYGMAHGKRMVNGFISRAPVESFFYIETADPMLSWLGQRRPLEPDAVRAQLRERVFGWPLGYIVVHESLIGREGPTLQEIYAFLNANPDLVCPFRAESQREQPIMVYRTASHPLGCPTRTPPESRSGVFRLELGDVADRGYLGEGWHWPEQVFGTSWRWAGAAPQATFYVDLPPGAYTLTVRAQAFAEPRQLRVLVNGQAVGETVTVPVEPLTEFTFPVPAALIGDGRHVTVTLAYDKALIPREIGHSADPRPLSIAVDHVTFTAQVR